MGTAVLICVLTAAAAGCGGSQAAGGQSGSAHRLPTVLTASQLRLRNAVRITKCAADGAENLELAGTVTNVLPRPAGFDLRFDIYDANGVLLKGPGAAFTSPGITNILPGRTGQFTEISGLNGSSTVTPVTCVLEGALVKRPRRVGTRLPAAYIPAAHVPAAHVPAAHVPAAHVPAAHVPAASAGRGER